MQLTLLRQRATEQLGKLRDTPFKDRIPGYEATIRFLDRLNPGSPVVSSFALRRYTQLLHDISTTLEMVAISGLVPSIQIAIPDPTSRLMYDLVEIVVRTETMEYVKSHGHGKLFVPHRIFESYTNAGDIIRSGAVDIGLSVEPEGCAYGYFFEVQGLPVLHVFADFDGNGGIDYKETEDLSGLSGKRVLLIEDDIQTGQTLRAVLAQIKRFGILDRHLFLGNLDIFQNKAAVPPSISKTHSNNGIPTIVGQEGAEAEFIRFFTGLLDKYRVFGQSQQ